MPSEMQKAMAGLFGVNVPAISKHIDNIFESGELERGSTVSITEIVQKEGTREVSRQVDHFNLDVIIAVGYRVNLDFRNDSFTRRSRKFILQVLIIARQTRKQGSFLKQFKTNCFGQSVSKLRQSWFNGG